MIQSKDEVLSTEKDLSVLQEKMKAGLISVAWNWKVQNTN